MVQPCAGVHEALEGFGQRARDAQVREPLAFWQLALRALAQPGEDDFAIHLDLVQVAAAQALVAHVVHAFEQQRVRLLECGPGVRLAAVRREGLRVPPPDVLAAPEVRAAKALRAVELRRLLGRLERGRGLTGGKQCPGERGQADTAVGGLLGVRRRQGDLQVARGGFRVARCVGQLACIHRAVRARQRLVDLGDERLVFGPDRARGVELAERDQPAEHAALLQRLVQARAGTTAEVEQFPAQSIRAPVEAEFGKREAQVADRHAAAEDVAATLEGRGGLLRVGDAFGQVLRREAEHVERIALAESVAALARQRERALRRRARWRGVGLAGVCEGQHPVRAPEAHGVAERVEEGDRALRVGHRLGVVQRTELRFRKAHECLSAQRVGADSIRQLDRLGGGAQCGLHPALAQQHRGLTVERRELESGLAGVLSGERQHGRDIDLGFRSASQRGERISALIEQVHLLLWRGRHIIGQRMRASLDGGLLLAGPGECAHGVERLRCCVRAGRGTVLFARRSGLPAARHLSRAFVRRFGREPRPAHRRGWAWSRSHPFPRPGTLRDHPASHWPSSRRCAGARRASTSR